MAIYTGVMLTGSANGLPIPVAATATPGTAIHTATGSTTGFDEVYLWASNVTNATETITVEWGGVANPGSHLVKAFSIAPNSPAVVVSPGLRLNNSLAVKAFCSTASAINVHGFINRNT